MSKRFVWLGLGALAFVAGMVVLRIVSQPPESFFRSQILVPHLAQSSGYELAWPYDGPIPGERVGWAEAQARLLFNVPLPKIVPEGARLVEIYVSFESTPFESRQVALVYSDGLYIIIRPESHILRWDSWIADDPETFVPLEVNGHQGVGSEPGPERICVSYAPALEWACEEGTGQRPGTVQFQAGGLVIEIYSYDHSLGELLRVAESMEIR